MEEWLPVIAIIATLLIGFGSLGSLIHFTLRGAIESNNRLNEQMNTRIDDSIRSNKEQFQAFLEAWKLKD